MSHGGDKIYILDDDEGGLLAVMFVMGGICLLCSYDTYGCSLLVPVYVE